MKSNKIDESDKDDIKEFLFTNIMALDGDVTRRIRELKNVFEDSKLSEEVLLELDDDELLDDVTDYFNNNGSTDKVELSNELTDKVRDITENFVERKKYKNARNQPMEMLKKAAISLKDVDRDSLKRLDEKSKKKFTELLDDVKKQINELSDI